MFLNELPLWKNCLSSPLVFSFVPLCHGEYGQKVHREYKDTIRQVYSLF